MTSGGKLSVQVGMGIWENFWSFIKRVKYPFEFEDRMWTFLGNTSAEKGLLKPAGHNFMVCVELWW